jgi:hypothetical protein
MGIVSTFAFLMDFLVGTGSERDVMLRMDGLEPKGPEEKFAKKMLDVLASVKYPLAKWWMDLGLQGDYWRVSRFCTNVNDSGTAP